MKTLAKFFFPDDISFSFYAEASILTLSSASDTSLLHRYVIEAATHQSTSWTLKKLQYSYVLHTISTDRYLHNGLTFQSCHLEAKVELNLYITYHPTSVNTDLPTLLSQFLSPSPNTAHIVFWGCFLFIFTLPCLNAQDIRISFLIPNILAFLTDMCTISSAFPAFPPYTTGILLSIFFLVLKHWTSPFSITTYTVSPHRHLHDLLSFLYFPCPPTLGMTCSSSALPPPPPPPPPLHVSALDIRIYLLFYRQEVHAVICTVSHALPVSPSLCSSLLNSEKWWCKCHSTTLLLKNNA